MQLRDFRCVCGLDFEDLVESSDVLSATCPSCGQAAERIISAPHIGVTNDPAKRAEILRKRSHEHTIKELKKEPERHGFEAADRKPWNIRKPASSS
jgi:putative FmdB family regulatory protein